MSAPRLIQIPRLPVDGDFPITARVGDTNKDHWSKGHKGTDFGSLWKNGHVSKSIAGEPFYSVWPGRVEIAGWHMTEEKDEHGKKTGKWVKGPLGIMVWVVSEVPGIGQICHEYCHAGLLICAVGMQVDEGQKLGCAGNTGNSTGPHLHWEIRTWPEREVLAPDLDEYFARLAKAGNPPTA